MRLDSHLLINSSLEIERVRQGGKRKRGRHEENILETQDPSWSETMIVSHASLRVRIFGSANCSYDAMSFRLARVKRIKIGLCNHFDASFTGSTLILIDQVILCHYVILPCLGLFYEHPPYLYCWHQFCWSSNHSIHCVWLQHTLTVSLNVVASVRIFVAFIPFTLW